MTAVTEAFVIFAILNMVSGVFVILALHHLFNENPRSREPDAHPLVGGLVMGWFLANMSLIMSSLLWNILSHVRIEWLS